MATKTRSIVMRLRVKGFWIVKSLETRLRFEEVLTTPQYLNTVNKKNHILVITIDYKGLV